MPRWDRAAWCSSFLPCSRGSHFFSPRWLRASFATPLWQAVTSSLLVLLLSKIVFCCVLSLKERRKILLLFHLFPLFFSIVASKAIPSEDIVHLSASLRCKGEDAGCCTAETPCLEGEGDCDDDSECAQGLKCGIDNCAFNTTHDTDDDCCIKKSEYEGMEHFQGGTS